MGINDLHTFFIYVFFGYILIFPAVLFCLKLFGIESPRQRIQLYLMALGTPFVGFILYHSVLTKRCQTGAITGGPGWQLFDAFCRLGNSVVLFLGPLLLAMMAFGLLKALASLLFVARIRKRGAQPSQKVKSQIEDIVATRSKALNVRTPEIIYSERDSFAAFTAGLFRPVIVISLPLLSYLSAGELEGILTHELVHIRRGDTLSGWFVHLARDVMFFSPFSTMLLDRYLLEKERLCDTETVYMLGESRQYAGTLLKVWRLLLDRREFRAGLSVSFTGKKRDMELRITSLLGGQETTRQLPDLLFYTLVFSLFTITLLYLGFIC